MLRYGVFYGFVRKTFRIFVWRSWLISIRRGDKLFSRLLEAETLADVRTLLDARTSPYWENHYLFGRLSSQKEKTMGERSKDLIIINTVVPFLYTYGLHKADERMCERAGRFLEELKAEKTIILSVRGAMQGFRLSVRRIVRR